MTKIAEVVGVGHPDRIADRIAENILRRIKIDDPKAKVAVEVICSRGYVGVAGEIDSRVPYTNIAKGAVKEILTTLGYKYSSFKVDINLNSQSTDIQNYSVSSTNIASGDQAIIYGYATNENKRMMPNEYEIAQDVSAILMKYGNDYKVLVALGKGICDVLVSVEETVEYNRKEIEDKIKKLIKDNTYREGQVQINPAGPFKIAGLYADSGVTNRKIIVDSYGPRVRHGGGGYNGKDLTKIDRLGAYIARYICKHIVASEVCPQIELQVTYKPAENIPWSFVITDIRFDERSRLLNTYRIEQLIHDLFGNIKLDYGLQKFSNYSYQIDLPFYGHFGHDFLPGEQISDMGKEAIIDWCKNGAKTKK